jgi:hypothetical protein
VNDIVAMPVRQEARQASDTSNNSANIYRLTLQVFEAGICALPGLIGSIDLGRI